MVYDDDDDSIHMITMDDSEASTYSEMIEAALRALGNQGSGPDITNYIEENYADRLTNKTKTWKNSVMGCLSANRKGIFMKVPMKENTKRYMWKLIDPSSSEVVKPEEEEQHSHNTRSKESATTESSPPKSPSLSKRRKSKIAKSESKDELSSHTNENSSSSEEEEPSAPKRSKRATENDESVNNNNEELPELGANISKEDYQTYLVKLIEQALKGLGGKGTGQEVTDYIVARHRDNGMNKKKLANTVNGLLSAKKYSNYFTKDLASTHSGRTVWKLITK
jgi:hypothetical protein